MIHGRFVKYAIRKSGANTWSGVRIASESLKEVYEDIELNYLTASLLPSPTVKGVKRVEGSIEGFVADSVTEGFLYKAFFQNETVVEEGQKHKHTFQVLNSFPTTFYTLDFWKELPGVEKRLFTNLKTTKISFAVEPNSILRYDFEVKGFEEQNPTTNINPVFQTLDLTKAWNVVIKINNITYQPKTVEVTLTEDSELDYRVGSRIPVSHTRAPIEATVKVDFLISSQTIAFRNQWKNDASMPVEIILTTDNNNKLALKFAKAIIRSYDENAGDELLTNTIELLAIAPDTQPENAIVVELTNGREDPY